MSARGGPDDRDAGGNRRPENGEGATAGDQRPSAFWLTVLASVPLGVIGLALVMPGGLAWVGAAILAVVAVAVTGAWLRSPSTVLAAGLLTFVAFGAGWSFFIPIHWLALVLATAVAYLVAVRWMVRPPSRGFDMAVLRRQAAPWTVAVALVACAAPVAVMAAIGSTGQAYAESVPEDGVHGPSASNGEGVPPLFIAASALCVVAAAGVLSRRPAWAWAGATLFTGVSALAYTLVFTLPLALPMVAAIGVWHASGLGRRARDGPTGPRAGAL